MRDLDDAVPAARAELRALYPHTGRRLRPRHHRQPRAPASRRVVDALIDALPRSGQAGRRGGGRSDPPFSGGAILGDRIRMQRHATDDGVFIRSLATRGHLGGLSRSTSDVGRRARRDGLRRGDHRDRRASGRTRSTSCSLGRHGGGRHRARARRRDPGDQGGHPRDRRRAGREQGRPRGRRLAPSRPGDDAGARRAARRGRCEIVDARRCAHHAARGTGARQAVDRRSSGSAPRRRPTAGGGRGAVRATARSARPRVEARSRAGRPRARLADDGRLAPLRPPRAHAARSSDVGPSEAAPSARGL